MKKENSHFPPRFEVQLRVLVTPNRRIGDPVSPKEYVLRQTHLRRVVRGPTQNTRQGRLLDRLELPFTEDLRSRVEEPIAVAKHFELFADDAVDGGAEDGADDRVLHEAAQVEVDVLGIGVGVEEALHQGGVDQVGHVFPKVDAAKLTVLPGK